MPSPIAHCKQCEVLLVVSLFLLGCVVLSSVGSTMNIRRQREEKNDLSQHSKAKEGGGGRVGLWAPDPGSFATYCGFQELKQRIPITDAAFDH